MNRNILKRLFKEAGIYRFLMPVSFLLAFVAAVFQLYLPVLFGKAIDTIISAGNVDFDALVPLLYRAAGCTAISSVATMLMSLVNNRIAYGTIASIRDQAIAAVQNLPLKYLDEQKTGDVTARIIADGDAICDGLVLGISQLFTGVVTIVVTLVFMLATSGMVTVAVIVLTPVSFLVARFISTHTYSLFKEQSKARGAQMGFVEEMVSGMNVV